MKKNKHKKIKALLLFSGGLDSMLAAKILEKQGIQVSLIAFTGFFFGADEAQRSAKILGKNLTAVDIAKKHLNIVKQPKHGYGRGLNPCVDCHLLMIKEAKKIMVRDGYQVLATGEVAGQRPMSQQTKQLKLIEQEAGLNNKILRPLSALAMEETVYEKKGLVDRKKLFGITGRSRKQQIKLACLLGVKDYPSPAGGCILTDVNFAKKLKNVIDKKPSKNDIELMKVGRYFNINKDGNNYNVVDFSGRENLQQANIIATVIIGRDSNENLKLQKLAKKSDTLMEAANAKGPLTLIRHDKKPTYLEKKKVIEKAAQLTKHYSTKTRNLDIVKIQYWHKGVKKNRKIIEI